MGLTESLSIHTTFGYQNGFLTQGVANELPNIPLSHPSAVIWMRDHFRVLMGGTFRPFDDFTPRLDLSLSLTRLREAKGGIYVPQVGDNGGIGAMYHLPADVQLGISTLMGIEVRVRSQWGIGGGVEWNMDHITAIGSLHYTSMIWCIHYHYIRLL